jgi:hypothetical protein
MSIEIVLIQIADSDTRSGHLALMNGRRRMNTHQDQTNE